MALKDLQPAIKLTIENPKDESGSAFGPGVAALCLGVRETGSLNAAAKNMGMAYSKAWRIMKDTESSLGVQLLVRDGAHGSTLTPECLALIDAYTKLQQVLETSSKEKYLKLIG